MAPGNPPGSFPGTETNSTMIQLTKKKKKKSKKSTSTNNSLPVTNKTANYDGDESDDLPPLEDVDESISSPTATNYAQNQLNNPLNTQQTNTASPNDLLTTASDLYRQIEAAAASALSSHPSFSASFPPPPTTTTHQPNGTTATTTDEAYWTSLPQHLRQFIRSALPLAAGLTTGPDGRPLPLTNSNGTTNLTSSHLNNVVSGPNGQNLPALTHDQLSNAAAQLAQVVQSNWGQLGLGPNPTNGQTGTQRGQTTTTTTTTGPNGATISLGSFPVTMPTREQMEAAIGSMGGLGADFSQMNLGNPNQTAFPNMMAAAAAAAAGVNSHHSVPAAGDETEEEGETVGNDSVSKKNKKKKKKKSQQAAAAAAVQQQQQAEEEQQRRVELIAAQQKKAQQLPAATNVPARTNLSAPPPTSRPIQQTVAAGKQPMPPQPKYDPYTPIVPHNKQQQQQQVPGAYPHYPPGTMTQPVSQYHSGTPSIAPKAGPSSERERIRDFWLGLQEDERRGLVKIEKDSVLRKMKEQQRTGCSCAVCGRKRSAIEEELEVLYEAYYDELESYALHQVRYASAAPGTVAAPPGPGPFPGSVDAAVANVPAPAVPPKKLGGIVKPTRDHKNVRPAAKKKNLTNPHGGGNETNPNNYHHPHPQQQQQQHPQQPQSNGPAHGEPGHNHSQSCPHHPHNHNPRDKAKGAAVVEADYEDEAEEEEEDDDEDYDDEDEFDEDEVDDEYDEEEDLPQTEPKKIKKDENADFFGFGKSLTVKGGILTVADDLLKNDGQKFLEMMEQLADKRIQREREATDLPFDGTTAGSEEDFDGEMSDSNDLDQDFDESDEEILTEAERIEEGRRMFQIFAARMFEQRVLTAYRERVASERQLQLLREIEAEERLAEEKELKKAKENQKKKDKKKDQKQKKEEERLKREAEREAAELAAKQAEETRLEAERIRNEEQRQRREAERRAKDEERQKKEEKLRLAKEAERQIKEEKIRLVREQREKQEQILRDKKAKEVADRKEREEREERERKEIESRDAKAEKERIQAQAEKAKLAAAAEKASLAAAAAAAQAQAAKQAKLQQQAQQNQPIPAVQQQIPKSPGTTARQPNSISTAAKAQNIPGLPKITANGPTSSKPVSAQSSVNPASVSPQPIGSRTPNLPPGMTPRQASNSLPAPPAQAQQQHPQSMQPIPMQQPRTNLPNQGMPNNFAARPNSQQPNQPQNLHPTSRMFPPPGTIGTPNNLYAQQSPGNPYMNHVPNLPGAPPPSHLSPGMGRSSHNSPIGPPPGVNSAATGAQNRLNGIHNQQINQPAPIAPPGVHSAASAATSPRSLPVGPIGGIIGRPPSAIGTPQQPRNISPPPRVFGSSALLEDDEIVVPPARGGNSAATSQPQSAGDWSSPFSATSGIWGAPATATNSNSGPQNPVAPIVTPDRNSVIRDRARVSYLKLDELNRGARAPIGITDIHSALITLWPDSVSVDLKELVESMLQPGNLVNGGGNFLFTQRGEGLYAEFTQ